MNYGAMGGGIGGFLQSMGQADQFEAYRKFNVTSANAAQRAAKTVLEQGRWQLTRLRMQEADILGSNAFEAARSGIKMEGSAADVQRFVQRQVNLDASRIWNNAVLARFGYLEQARAYKTAARANRSGAQYTRAAGLINLYAGMIGAGAGG